MVQIPDIYTWNDLFDVTERGHSSQNPVIRTEGGPQVTQSDERLVSSVRLLVDWTRVELGVFG